MKYAVLPKQILQVGASATGLESDNVIYDIEEVDMLAESVTGLNIALRAICYLEEQL